MAKLHREEKFLDQKKYEKHLEYLNMMKNNVKEQKKCPRRNALSVQLAYLFRKLEDIKEADSCVLATVGEKFDKYVNKINEFRTTAKVTLKDLDKLDESIQKQCKLVQEMRGISSAKKQLILQNGNKLFKEIDILKKSAK